MRTASFFQRLLAPPRYLTMPVVGLGISDTSVKFAELRMTRAGLRLGRYGDLPIPAGVLHRGIVARPDELKEILGFMRRKFGLSHVAASIPDERAFLLRMEIPGVRRHELRGAIELQIEERVPVSAREATFDFEIIREPTGSGGDGVYEVSVAVVPTSVARSYFEFLTEAGFLPLVFELESQAIARAVVPRGDKGTFLLVDLGKIHTGLAVASGGIVWFATTITSGGDDLVKALMKRAGVAEEDARKLKETKGLFSEDDGMPSPELTLAAGVLRDEIGKHFNYWNSHRNEEGATTRGAIEEVIFCGGEANVPGLVEYLASGLAVRHTIANPWVNIASFEDYIPPIPAKDSLKYATVLGLALRTPS